MTINKDANFSARKGWGGCRVMQLGGWVDPRDPSEDGYIDLTWLPHIRKFDLTIYHRSDDCSYKMTATELRDLGEMLIRLSQTKFEE
jgi:hypothetical protein